MMWSEIRRVLWNEISRNELHPGTHIYTLKEEEANTKRVHHGIYVDDNNVIHFTQGHLLSINRSVCDNCGDQSPVIHGLLSSCIQCFLSGGEGDVYRFEYNVSPSLFLLKPGWGTCTTAHDDPSNINVRDRAFYFLRNGSADEFKQCIKNSYDFAIYCKTGLIVVSHMKMLLHSPPVNLIFATSTIVFLFLLYYMPPSFTAVTAAGLGIYSTCRLNLEIQALPNSIPVEVYRFSQVRDLTSHYVGKQRTLQYYFKLVCVALACALISSVLSSWYLTRPLVWVLLGFKFLYWAAYNRTFEVKRVLSNKIERCQLTSGDHIYTWRGTTGSRWLTRIVYFYSHHGIYVGRNRVIHLTRGASPHVPSSASISHPSNNGGEIRNGCVEICSLESFLEGGKLYRYDYGIDVDFFLAKSRGGTGTLAHSSKPGIVLHRAYYLLENGYASYNLFVNNCEDFALYCKTGLLLPNTINLGRSGQIISIFGFICSFIRFPYSFLLSSFGNFLGGLVLHYVLYSIWRSFFDLGLRGDTRMVGVQKLDAYNTRIVFMSWRRLLSSGLKCLLCLLLILMFLFPEHPIFGESQNCLISWSIFVFGMRTIFV